MRNHKTGIRVLGIAGLILASIFPSLSAAGDLPEAGAYREIGRFELGGSGGWDCLAVDSIARRVYIARSDRVMVVNADTGKTEGELTGLEGAHGIAIDKEKGLGFAASGKSGEVFVFQLSDLRLKAKIRTGENPDIVLFEPLTGNVFAFNGKSRDLSVIDPGLMKVVGTLSLPGKPEFAVSDGKGKVFVNIEDRSTLEALDVRNLKRIATYPLTPCESPSGLAIDAGTNRLIVGCGNRTAVILNSETGQVLQSFKAGSGVDGAAFDASRNVAFISAGEGLLTVLSEETKGFKFLQELPTVRGSRTMAVDEKTGSVFLPMAKFEVPRSDTGNQGRVRPVVVSGTFALMVIGR